MRYYKIVSNGYIISVGTGNAGEEITAQEYSEIIGAIKSAPTVPEGYTYMLTESLEWKFVEVETPDVSEEATEEDYQIALAEMGVQV